MKDAYGKEFKAQLPLHYEMCGSNCWSVKDINNHIIVATIDDSPLGRGFSMTEEEYKNYIVEEAEKAVAYWTKIINNYDQY